ncbi:hypothetical protein BDW75DRAFT_136335 [Aspergillus navahoensis]
MPWSQKATAGDGQQTTISSWSFSSCGRSVRHTLLCWASICPSGRSANVEVVKRRPLTKLRVCFMV